MEFGGTKDSSLELQLGTGFVSRQFHYHAGVATEEHVDNNMLKSSPTTQLVSQIVLSGGRTISYEYDEEERITKVDDSVDGITTYTYDALGQLLTETVNGITTKFEYDNYGNILAKGVVDETGEIAEATKSTYVYGDDTWKDLLTAYNGQSIVYDKQGNPTSYLGHTLTWEKGRQLKSFDNIAYTYNANGIRTSKTVDGIKHTYTLDGTKILREEWNGNTLIPLYDNEEAVCGILYNNEPYYFQKNLQGDIIGIVDKSSKVVANYSYDAWGVCSIAQDSSNCQIATINPYRYRGYYFDEEIGMYYLQSRYYNPSVGRFVNGDSVENQLIDQDSMLQYNTYGYCLNNPIKYKDVSGQWVQVVVGAIVGAIFSALTYWLEWKFGLRKWNGWAFAGHIALAAVLGAAGAYFRYWASFTNLAAKIAQKLYLISKIKAFPLIKLLINWGSRGITFAINSIAKKFTRKKGESWTKFIKRYFGW